MMIFFSEISEKSIKKTVFALLALFFISLAACDSMPEECLSQLERPFRTEVEGEINGKEVKAEIFCDPTEHKTKEIYDRLTVTFLSPKSLDGITVTLRSDGKATVRLKDSEETLPLYSGLCEPFASLWQSSEPRAVRKTDDGYEIEFKEESYDMTYFFDKDGKPKRIQGETGGRKIELNITKFEQIEK